MAVRDFNDLISQIDIIIVENTVGSITPTVHNPLLKDVSDTLKALSNNFTDLSEDASNQYSGTPASALNAYDEGTILLIKVDVTNTGAVLIDVSGLGQRGLKKESGGSLVDITAGELKSGIFYSCVVTSSYFQLLGAIGGGGGGDMLAANNLSDVANATTSFGNIKQAATTTTTGVVELATDGESAADKVVQSNDSRMHDARTPTSHGIGGSEHSSSTLAQLNSKISDATLIDGDAALPRVLQVKTEALPYTLVAADAGKHIELTGSGAFTIPTGLAIGSQFSVALDNATAQNIISAGVTIKTINVSSDKISGNGIISIAIIASDTARISGNTQA